MEKAAAAAHNPWVLLDRRPRELSAATPGDKLFKFDLDDPPLRSAVSIRQDLFPTGSEDLVVAAVEPTGRFVLCATEPAPQSRQLLVFCDGTDGAARHLPITAVTVHRGNIGVIAAPDGGYIVAGLLHAEGADQATIRTFRANSDAQDWMEVSLNFPLGAHSPWRGNTVIAHDRKLWWVDAFTGLLCFDPSAANPTLVHVELPAATNLPGGDPLKRRCIQVSGGNICFVVLEGTEADKAVIKAWILVCDEDGLQKWEPDYELPFAEVQVHPAHKWPNGVPSLEAIHPYYPNVVYLSVDHYLCEIKLNSGEITMSKMVKEHNELLHMLVVPLNGKPWTLVTSPINLTSNLVSLDKDEFLLETYGTTPRITHVHFQMRRMNGFKINYAFVVAVHCTGPMLICTVYQRENKGRGKKKGKKDNIAYNAYFLTVGSEIQRLPILSSSVDQHIRNAGLCVDSSGATCVAIFQPSDVPCRATLYYWKSTHEDKWNKICVQYLVQPSSPPWHGSGVVSHESMLWWSDLTHCRCLLKYEPFSAGDQLEHYLLPEASKPTQEEFIITTNISSGMIRLAMLEGPVQALTLKLWTLLNPIDGVRLWQHQYTLDFNSVWNNPSFILTGLPTKQLVFLLLVHPQNPDLTYFWKEPKIFAINSAGTVIEIGDFVLAAVPEEEYALIHWSDYPLKSLDYLPTMGAPQILA